MDSGATHCYVSEAFVRRHGFQKVEQVSTNLRLATGASAQTVGFCTFTVDIQSYTGTVGAFVVRLNTDFDMILGQNWCKANGVDIMYTQDCLQMSHSTVNSSAHRLLCDAAHFQSCAIVSAAHLKDHLDDSDRMVICMVRPAVDQAESPVTSSVAESADVTHSVAESSEQAELDAVLAEYKDVFAELPNELPPERTVFHTIPLKEGAEPPPRKSYRLSRPEMQEVDKQVKALLAKGYIRPSSSPYGAPVIFVLKADGTLRMCIDYRGLNKQTVKNRFPIPRIDDLFDQLAGAKVFSSIDLQSAYHQVRLKPEDVPKTAFTTPMGLYESLVLTFGLTNAPGTFQSVMNEVLGDVIGKFVLVYLDDLVIFSKNAEGHVEHVRIVLGLLRRHKLYAKLAKCTFMQSELKFLGHIVGAQGLQVDPKKVAIVRDWPVPTGVALLRSFLGLANYFRKFVQGWSALVAPLQRLTKKDKEFVWSAECDQAFEGVKEALTHAPVLALPDLNNRFEVICDACGVGLGAVPVQGGRPIAFEGKRMSEAEQKYTTGEKELLAVVHALELWRCYLDGVEFTVVTDHSPNTFFHTQAVLSPRQARWAEKLSRFSFQWEYRAGRNNVADPLSRHPDIMAHMVMCAVSENANGADLMDVDGSGRVADILAGYATDDEVLLSTEHIPLRSVGTRKLLMKWMGPFKVVQRVNDVAYELELPKPWKIHNVFHVSLLKPYHKSGRHQPPPPALLVEGEEEFEVEEILSHEPRAKTKSDNKVKFLVKWRGFGHENNTWEPFKNMKNAPDSLKEYWDRVAVQAAQPSKGTGRGVAPTGRGRMAPVSRRLRSSR